MIRLPASHSSFVSAFFELVHDTLVPTCLEGEFGEIWVDSQTEPQCAKLSIADFLFLGGDASAPHAEQLLLEHIPFRSRSFVIAIPMNEDWAQLIERLYGNRAKSITRYAISTPTLFDTALLTRLSNTVPEGYEVKQFDSELYRQAMSQDWSIDFCSAFLNEEDYLARGLGVGVLKDGVLVAGASSYTAYRHGIEIEVDTQKEHRQLGLATTCCAKLILLCLERQITPGWDAANLTSVKLAERLGYRLNHEYKAFLITLTSQK